MNPYYNSGSFPATGSPATSASMRAELALIAAGFDKLPTPTGNANKLVSVNEAGTALVAGDDISQVDFDTAGTAGAVARLKWNDVDGTLDLGLKGGNVTLQIGQEEVQMVRNNTGTAIAMMQAVYITGSNGNRVTVALAQANAEPTSTKVLGITTEAIGNGVDGFVTTHGLVRDVNTSAFAEGAVLWLSAATAGGITTTRPTPPNHGVMLGYCVRSHASQGVIYVVVQNGYELDELHDVLITSVANNNMLKWDSATGVWKNVAGPAGDVVGTTDAQTLTNKTISGASNTLSNIGNASLTNSAVTIGSTSIALGGTATSLAGLTNLTASGNGSFGGTLGVTGATTLTGALTANGAVTLGDAAGDVITINGTTTFANTNPTLSAGTANGVAYLNGSKVLTTGSGLVFDGSNLGLGVTPSAWGAVNKAIDIGTIGGIAADTATMRVLSNAYSDSGGTFRYRTTAAAFTYIQNASIGHAWITAPSGIAGDPISFTQAMTLDASGNLSLANTDGGYRLRVRGTSNDGAVSSVRIESANAAQGINISFSQILGDTGNTAFGTSGNFPTTFVTNNVERARIDSSGNLLVGSTNGVTNGGFMFQPIGGQSTAAFGHIAGTGSGQPYAQFYYNGTQIGSITQAGTTAVAYNTSSDYRLKEDIQPMTGALAKVAALKPCTYKWKADGSEGEGFIAHELAEVVPQCVTGEKDAVDDEGSPVYQGIDTSFLVATLTAAIQEQQAIIESLTARIAALEAA